MGIHQSPDGAGFAPARGFPLTITQTQRPVEIGAPGVVVHFAAFGGAGLLTSRLARTLAPPNCTTTAPGGHRTHISRMYPGVLSLLNYGTVRESAPTSGADHGCGFVAVQANSDGQVAMLTEGLQLAGFEPAPLELSHKRSLAIKIPPPFGGG